MSIIFDSFANIVKVTEELEHLPQSARDLFGSQTGITLSSFSWNKHEEWGSLGRWICRWASIGADLSQESAKGSITIGRALLCIDLYRDRLADVRRRKLDHAEVPLLTCGFIAGPNVAEDETYDVEYLKFDSYGWPLRSAEFIRHADGRLLEYAEDGRKDRPWAQRSWIFTVPLESIHNPRAFRAEVSSPFWATLQDNLDMAFPTNSSACMFPGD